MSGGDLTPIQVKAYQDLEDPIARLQTLLTVAYKFHESVLEYEPAVPEMLLGSGAEPFKHLGRIFAINDDDYEALNFIMLEVVFAVRALHEQYFGRSDEAKIQGESGAKS